MPTTPLALCSIKSNLWAFEAKASVLPEPTKTTQR